MIKVYSYGSDPEFIIKDRETGKNVSSLGIIPGDKDSPVEIIREGFSIQKDNVLAEVCVPPENTLIKVYDNILEAKQYIEDTILPDSLELGFETTGEYDSEDVSNPFAQTFGCSESQNAWTESTFTVPSNNSNLRSAGFHIHFGLEIDSFRDTIDFIKMLDLTIGVPSILLDGDIVRRQQYGRAGEFRPTIYGVEYRVLGAGLLARRENIKLIQEGINKAVNLLNSERPKFSDEDSMLIQTCINISDTELAYELIEKYSLTEVLESIRD